MNDLNQNNKKKRNIYNDGLRIVAVLALMVVLSCSLISGLFARYSTGTTQSDGARVARYYANAVVEDGQEKNFSVTNDQSSVIYKFSVVNFLGDKVSEVAIEYGLVVTISPSDDAKYDGGSIELLDENGNVINFEDGTNCELSDNGKKLTIKRIDEFEAAKKTTKNYGLKITVTGDSYGQIGVNLTVTASQKKG